MGRSRYKFGEDHYPHFLTCTINAWLPVFSNPDFVEITLDSWRFLQRERDIEILGWVILENHLHWIGLGPSLGKRVGEFKSYTATRILRQMQKRGYQTLLDQLRFFKQRFKKDQDHQLWQEGSHPKRIDTDEMMWQKLDYIHHNPVKRGYVDDPIHWRYSSARSYAGEPGLLEVCRDWR
ncbi:hypothetical protein Enr13x_59240 [Stieleria neptunia]|uniref:Transposase IS200-like domain-containing protein n=1 Tax=Stieleria neptunia TaxID=2527979 RepID=A0A518HYU0_9BACT|nr:transposase [Stieleria neptunia]QDV46020.1 hypothetical protein Enr13x_59240 [Stieleria neptunia]